VGAGLVDVPDTPAGDPAAAVMTPEKVQSVLGTVPEDERNCAKCGKPVGRGTAERAGRPKGFCGTCRTEFDFHTNAPTLQPGELVAGQYEILGPLAHGGLGWIYLGRDKQVSDRWVVLKGLLNASDPDAAAAAVAERRFLAEIDHASIVNIYNFVTHAGAGYIVMEYVGGESLNSKLKARRRANNDVADPLPVPEAIAYVLGVLPAFSYLHDRGMVYNDLKPANVMAVGDSVKLIDLGAVMRADDMAAAIFGTEGFQAPEVAADGPSAASDIYTVGRTLAVLTLKFAFHAGKYQYALPSPADEPLFAKWESYYRFLLKATAPHPDDRFASIADMEDQLLGVLQEIVAVTRGAPVITASSHFGPDRIPALLADAADNGFQSTDADWRVLPRLKIDPEDPAAGFLVNLPDIEPQRVLELIASAEGSGQITATREVQLRRARCLIEMSKAGARATAAESLLGQVEADDPWDWRVTWLRGMGLLLDGRWHEAAGRFSQVWTDLPGEQAPMLAVALAAEREGEMERAAEIYTRVLQTDRTYVSAAFGLARCRAAQGDRGGAVNAYRAIPNSSSTYMEAQIAATRTMVDDSNGGPPTADELAAAAQNVERMQLDASERAKLSADILERALTSVGDGTLAETHSTRLFGHTLTEKSLRTALSDAYRNMARLTPDTAETHRLIDKANLVRPRTLL
jgi:serine/threonine-protein kinase PknG